MVNEVNVSVINHYRNEAEALLRLSRETENAADHARYVLAAQMWLSRAVAAEERSFASLGDPDIAETKGPESTEY
jgi:hypothetical protein